MDTTLASRYAAKRKACIEENLKQFKLKVQARFDAVVKQGKNRICIYNSDIPSEEDYIDWLRSEGFKHELKMDPRDGRELHIWFEI